MTKKTLRNAFLALSYTLLSSSLVWGASYHDDYQEVSYDDLLNELNTKKAAVKVQKAAPPKSLAVGVGYVHGLSQFNIRHRSSTRFQNGLQLAARMGLDKPNLYAEGVFRNYSGSNLTSEELQILQLDGRLGLTNTLTETWKYDLFTGLSGRLIQASNAAQNYSVSEFAPAITIGAGFTTEIHKNIRLGFELGGRSSMMGQNTEKNAVDFALRLDTTL